MIKNWELKIKENKSTLIINDWGVKSDDINHTLCVKRQ